MEYKVFRFLYGFFFLCFGLILVMIAYLGCPCQFQSNFALALGFILGSFISEVLSVALDKSIGVQLTRIRKFSLSGVFFHHWVLGIPLIIIGIVVQMYSDIVIGRVILGFGLAVFLHDLCFHLIVLVRNEINKFNMQPEKEMKK